MGAAERTHFALNPRPDFAGDLHPALHTTQIKTLDLSAERQHKDERMEGKAEGRKRGEGRGIRSLPALRQWWAQ
jgi:hypothetical protein